MIPSVVVSGLLLLQSATDSDPTVLARIGDPRFRHCGEVRQVAMHPDGKRFAATAVGENGARFWDAATGRQIRRFQHPDLDSAYLVRFSDDGRRLVVIGVSGDLVCFDTETAKPIRSFQVKTHHEWSPVFSPNGRHIAAFAVSGLLGVWNVETGESLFTCPRCERENHHFEGLSLAAFSRDSSRIAVCVGKRAIWVAPLCDSSAGRQIEITFPDDEDREGASDPLWLDDERVVVHFGMRPVVVDLASKRGKPIEREPGEDPISHVFRGRNGNLYGVLGAKEAIELDPRTLAVTGKQAVKLGGVTRDWATRNEGDPDWPYIVKSDGRLRAIRVEPVNEPATVEIETRSERIPLYYHGSMKVLDGGKRLATDGHVWDVSGPTPVWVEEDPKSRVVDFVPPAWRSTATHAARHESGDPVLAVSPNGKWVIAGGHERLAAHSTGKGAVCQVLDDYRGRPKPRHIAIVCGVGNDAGISRGPTLHPDQFLFHPSGRLFGFRYGYGDADPQTTLTVFHLERPGTRGRPEADPFRLNGDGRAVAVELSADGRQIAAVVTQPGSERWQVRVYETATLTEVYRVAPPNGVCAVEFDPDGTRLFVAHNDTTYSIYSVDRLLKKHLPNGDPTKWDAADPKVGLAAVRALARSPDAVEVVRAACVEPTVDVPRLIRDLGDREYKTREAATTRLVDLGWSVVPALRAAVSDTPEAAERIERLLNKVRLVDDRLRPNDRKAVRAVEVLERVGTREAVEVLTEWAKGEAAVRKAEAEAALVRLARKK